MYLRFGSSFILLWFLSLHHSKVCLDAEKAVSVDRMMI